MMITIFYFILCLLLSISEPLCSVNLEEEMNPKIHIALDDGFLPNEKINIYLIKSNGEKRIVFSDLLVRKHRDDVNFFDSAEVEKGRFNKLRIESPERDVRTEIGFILKKADIFISLTINMRNEFAITVSDEMLEYD